MRAFVISCIIIFFSLSLQSCYTVKKTDVSCPEFSGPKFKPTKNKISWNNNFTDLNKLNPGNYHRRPKSITNRNDPNSMSNSNSSGNNKIKISEKLEFTGMPDKSRYLKQLEVAAVNEIYSQTDACDTIFLKSGSCINVKINRTGLKKIRYRDCNNPNGAIRSIKKSEISYIRFANKDQRDSSPKKSPKRKSDPVGIAGFVLSVAGLPFLGSLSFTFISLVLTGCLLGWISSNRIKKHPDKFKGKGLAEISIVLGYALLIFLILFVLIILISKIV
jgi:hypothetical protein